MKEIKLPISKFVDTKFRDYAVYVLESRGIPSFYDALTPVQRYILMNSPTSFGKTLSVVGKSIEDGYHHGDGSLQKAIAKLARPFGAAEQILEGYGFFGSEVCPEPAAARYTSVRISSTANDIIKKYKHLMTKEDEGSYDPFWMDLPLGLTTQVVGIAVGYNTKVLPRKLSDIQQYLEGKRKSVKPFFQDFKGKISKYKGLENSWLIQSDVKVEGSKLLIREIPPLMKYTTVLKKLDVVFEQYHDVIRLLNNSNKRVEIDVIYRGKSTTQWKEIQEKLTKLFSIIVKEIPVFIKDGQVLVYEKVEDYLDDYKWQLKRLAYHETLHQRNFLDAELKFNIAKKEFITFMLQKRRSIVEVDKFLKPYDNDVKERLERLTSKKFTKDELQATTVKIRELTSALKKKERELIKVKREYDKTPDPTLSRGVSSKKTNIDLFETDDVEEVDGMFIWDGADVFDEDE